MTVTPGSRSSSTRAVEMMESLVARFVWVVGMEGDDHGVVILQVGGQDPGAVGGGVTLPMDEVLQVAVAAAALVSGVQYRLHHEGYSSIVADDRVGWLRSVSVWERVAMVLLQEGDVEDRVDLHGVGKLESEG